MGNLARATYLDTTDYMWPFSTNACNNKTRYAQEINACNDNPKFGMQPNRGRGAAEIDFLEVMFMVSWAIKIANLLDFVFLKYVMSIPCTFSYPDNSDHCLPPFL